MKRNQDILFQGLTSLFFSINLLEILLHCKKMWTIFQNLTALELSKVWYVFKVSKLHEIQDLTDSQSESFIAEQNFSTFLF
jgi:hypothetical protein